MKTIKGDLIELALSSEFDLIVHGCNCFNTMGAGIAKSIKSHFPKAYEEDLKTKKGDKNKLGTFTIAIVKTEKGNLTILNGYTQYHWKGKGIKADYKAIRNVFKKIKKQFSGLRIGYPAIGAGLAGGNWATISEIIDQELKGENHTFVEYLKK